MKHTKREYSKKVSKTGARRQLDLMRARRLKHKEKPEHSKNALAYYKAAAVLSCFEPGKIHPCGAQPDDSGEAHRALLPVSDAVPSRFKGFDEDQPINQYQDDSTSVNSEDRQSPWTVRQLHDRIRRQTLQQLNTRAEMQLALEANSIRPDDAVQRAMDALIMGNQVDFSQLNTTEISGYITAADWLRPVLEGIPEHNKLQRYIARANLLAPMKELVGDHFIGRESSLRVLRDYVDLMPTHGILESITRGGANLYYSLIDRPPLFIHGPGGIGKSTLIAKFILDHVNFDSDRQLPFVYINFDRAIYTAGRPLTLLNGALQQLAAQFPEAEHKASELIGEIHHALDSDDTSESSKSLLSRDYFYQQFSSFVKKVCPEDMPVLFVLDTFEEVQFMGDEVVDGIWVFLDELQQALPRLRVVIAGRALAEQFRAVPEPLDDLDPELAGYYVKRMLMKMEMVNINPKMIADIVSVAGSNPLSLRLAAQLFASEGSKGLNDIDTRNLIGLRLSTEIVQGRLYGRVLEHLHDPVLRKLAHPGLIVRRITPEIIRKVLAKPCGIKLHSGEEETLFSSLAREVALVEIDPEDGALCHRPDVRRNMLKDIEASAGNIAAQIDRSAIAYYKNRPGIRARAEEIYHRLRLDQSSKTIDRSWEDGVDVYLRNSIDELPTNARIYLTGKLGATPDYQLLQQTELAQWEKLTLRRVQRLLSSGATNAALEALRERSERSSLSPLFSIEMETLRTLGLDFEALHVIERAIQSATTAKAPKMVAEMLRHKSLIHEKSGDLTEALSDVEKAIELLKNARMPVEYMRVAIARLRLLRKLGQESSRQQITKSTLKRMTPALLHQLRKFPTLLREAAAELGDLDSQLLRMTVEKVGIEAETQENRDDLADLMSNWDNRTKSSKAPGTLSEFARMPVSGKRANDWQIWVSENAGRKLDRFVQQSIRQFDIENNERETLVKNFRNTVDRTIIGKF